MTHSGWFIVTSFKDIVVAIVLSLMLIAGVGMAMVAWWRDRQAAARRTKEAQKETWNKAQRFISMGATAAMILLLQSHTNDLSPAQLRTIERWLQQKAHENDV